MNRAALLHEFDWWELAAIGREHNREADGFANAAIDEMKIAAVP